MTMIPPPPLNSLQSLTLLGGAVAAVLIGVSLLLWGRIVHRAFLALAGAVTGLAVSGLISAKFNLSWMTVCIIAVVIGIIVGLALARIIWSLLAGVCGGAAAAAVLIGHYISRNPETFSVTPPAADMPLQQYFNALGTFLIESLQAVRAAEPIVPMIVLIAATILPLGLFTFLPRLGKIVMTGLLGAAMIFSGLTVISSLMARQIFDFFWWNWHVSLIVLGVLALFGIAMQYRGALKATAESEKKDDSNNKSETKGDGDTKK